MRPIRINPSAASQRTSNCLSDKSFQQCLNRPLVTDLAESFGCFPAHPVVLVRQCSYQRSHCPSFVGHELPACPNAHYPIVTCKLGDQRFDSRFGGFANSRRTPFRNTIVRLVLVSWPSMPSFYSAKTRDSTRTVLIGVYCILLSQARNGCSRAFAVSFAGRADALWSTTVDRSVQYAVLAQKGSGVKCRSSFLPAPITGRYLTWGKWQLYLLTLYKISSIIILELLF